MGSPTAALAEHIGLPHLTAAVPTLRALGHPADALVLDDSARRFCAALLAHRRSPAYRVHLTDPDAVPCDDLVRALLRAADLLCAVGDPDALGSWCAALAARLGAVLEFCDPAVTRTIACISTAADGTGELVLFPYDPEDAASLPGFDDEPER